ncbi:MAG: HypC/HybG/HupF family hydrogenase formation chaperone, partial [Patescibacteria group bacterium]
QGDFACLFIIHTNSPTKRQIFPVIKQNLLKIINQIISVKPNLEFVWNLVLSAWNLPDIMCLTIPGKVLEIKNNKALLQMQRGVRPISIGALKNIKVGDWLLATVDFAVKKINKKEAGEILELLETKDNLSLINKINPKIKEILKNASSRDLKKQEILALLKTNGNDAKSLFSEADITRKTYLKDFICIHGIVEFSNYCQNNCQYCGLRQDNKKLKRYRMSINEIVKVADNACNKIGYKMIVLQSGLDFGYSNDELVRLTYEIKKYCRCFLFVSVGERSLECYKKMKKAGADGALLRFETSNEKLYKKIHNEKLKTKEQKSKMQIKNEKSILSNRLNLIRNLQKIGYYVASGFLIGLPGQTLEDITDDILMCKKLGIQMVTFGPFVPCKNTSYQTKKSGNMDLVYKTIAISRLLIKRARIPITTAAETQDFKARHFGLQRGANSLMFNLTPKKYAKDYKIYSNKVYSRDKKLEKLALFSNKESWKMIEKELG